MWCSKKYILTVVVDFDIISPLKLSEKLGEKMLETYIIFAFCMAGCAGHAFFMGRRTGVEATVSFLMDKGILELDEESPSL